MHIESWPKLNHASISAPLSRTQHNRLSRDVNPFPDSHGLVEKLCRLRGMVSFLDHNYITGGRKPI
ncbi:hypothetical protein PILCRDRAFT_823061 [Piloderma croceum F 1598]|uniref:Uncharacterized protein n=1 Tax=Piloderma croceum (strain F 1598) TaxID=765440 RepID=A0A0C3FK36_PILCF|nr:hypothetical protein PILCRDRAFT_823061 [Piloderma croceum F 1598]